MSEKAPVGYLFQMTCDTGNGKHLTISGNFGVGDTVAFMNTEVDKVGLVMDRLRAQHELPLIEERIEGTRGQLESQVADLQRYDRQHPVGAKHRDEGLIDKMNANIAMLRVNIAKGEIALAQAQLKAK